MRQTCFQSTARHYLLRDATGRFLIRTAVSRRMLQDPSPSTEYVDWVKLHIDEHKYISQASRYFNVGFRQYTISLVLNCLC